MSPGIPDSKMNCKLFNSQQSIDTQYDDFDFEFSPDSKLLAIQTQNNTIEIYDGEEFKPKNITFELQEGINCFEFTHDSQSLALGVNRGIKIVNIY